MKAFAGLVLAGVTVAKNGGSNGNPSGMSKAYCQLNNTGSSGEKINLFLHSKPPNGTPRLANVLKGGIDGFAANETLDINVLDACSGTDLSVWSGQVTTNAGGNGSVMANWLDVDTADVLNSGSPWSLEFTDSSANVVGCCTFSETRINMGVGSD